MKLLRVRLAYGETGLDIEVDPAVTTVVEPVRHDAAADRTAALPCWPNSRVWSASKTW